MRPWIALMVLVAGPLCGKQTRNQTTHGIPIALLVKKLGQLKPGMSYESVVGLLGFTPHHAKLSQDGTTYLIYYFQEHGSRVDILRLGFVHSEEGLVLKHWDRFKRQVDRVPSPQTTCRPPTMLRKPGLIDYLRGCVA